MTTHARTLIICVVGARPNFMKVKPVMDALERRGVTSQLVHTGQHYDAGMSQVFFDDLQLRRPDIHLGIGSGTQAEQVAGVPVEMDRLISARSPNAVIVFGDVNSTLGAALATAKTPTLLAHVEAGLRSGDWSMPEEVNRVVIDRVSDVLFASSRQAVSNLLREGHHAETVELVGDVMAETLHRFLPAARRRPIVERLGLTPDGYALATMHRPANVDDRDRLTDLLGTLEELATDIPVILPLHPRTRRRMAEHRVPTPRCVTLTEPLGYLDFVGLEVSARLVLTDSGSVQEEARCLGLPCLTLRDTTERHDTVLDGVNQLVGANRSTILSAARSILGDRRERPPWAEEGSVGERMVAAVLRRMSCE